MYLVFDVGGTFIKYALMTIDGNILEKHKVSTDSCGNNLNGFITLLSGIYQSYKEGNMIEGIALAIPGLVDVENGIVYEGGALPYLHKMNIGAILSEACDGITVALENDGKCAALAEVWQGNAKDCDNAFLIVVGTGIGGGIVINRHVYRGNALVAGELSFLLENMTREEVEDFDDIDNAETSEERWKCGKYIAAGCCSTNALRKRVANEKGISEHDISGEDIFQMAEQGDKVCIDAIEDMCFMLAKHCMDIYMIMNPDIILIGGGISAQPKFIPCIQKYADKIRKITHMYDKLVIKPCKFGNDSNLIGALYHYIQRYIIGS
ncbi:MAG: ROK family protein [Coprococcus sp.]|nr:ROK family protein [Coprococcus sp.]